MNNMINQKTNKINIEIKIMSINFTGKFNGYTFI